LFSKAKKEAHASRNAYRAGNGLKPASATGDYLIAIADEHIEMSAIHLPS